MTWAWDHGDMAGMETLVTIEFAAAGAETDLTLTHEKLPSRNAVDMHNQGWTSSFKCLEQSIEAGGLA